MNRNINFDNSPSIIPGRPQKYQNVINDLNPVQNMQQETPQELFNNQNIITPNQQHHSQHNLNSELVVQPYLIQKLTDPLLIAKQQAQQINLNWTNSINQVQLDEKNDEQKLKFDRTHEVNSFHLNSVKDQNMLCDNVVLSSIQFRPQFNAVNKSPSVRLNRSQAQQRAQLLINQQQSKPTIPMQQFNQDRCSIENGKPNHSA